MFSFSSDKYYFNDFLKCLGSDRQQPGKVVTQRLLRFGSGPLPAQVTLDQQRGQPGEQGRGQGAQLLLRHHLQVPQGLPGTK